MQEEKTLRKLILGCLVLICICIICSEYVHRIKAAEFKAAKVLLVLVPEYAKGEEDAESGEPAPADVAIPVATPLPEESMVSQAETVPTGMVPTLAPLPSVWQEVAGAQESVVVRKLQDVSVVVLEKTEGCGGAGAFLEELPTTRQLRVTIHGMSGGVLSDEQVKRVARDTYYSGTPPTPTATPSPTPTLKPGKATPTPVVSPSPTPTLSPSDPYYVWRNDVVKAIESTTEIAEDGSTTQSLLLTLDKTYVYQLYEDEWNYYIALVRPKDVYDKIIVVDAGHGGLDAGTISAGNVYMEKNMNLDIVLRLKELLDGQDWLKVYYTRTTDWKPSLRQRVDLANDVEADFFLSVHCNANETHSLHGTEVLYDSRQNALAGMNSRRFAQLLLEEMDEHLGLFNRGLVARENSLTIIKYAEVPTALVEVAFMSNASDMQVLAKEETRAQVAQGLFDALMRAYAELDNMTRGNLADELDGGGMQAQTGIKQMAGKDEGQAP